jgi:anthranilate synthase component 2
LVQYFGQLGATVDVFRNDAISVEDIDLEKYQGIVISPGPCDPNEAGISLEVIRHFAGRLPILGVCLGHQSIGQAFGGEIVKANKIMHGKLSSIYHLGTGVFQNLPTPFTATRYHSLVIGSNNIPDCLEVTAWTVSEANEREEIMGVRHKEFPIEGVQFHPESILSDHGRQLLKNFLVNCGC